MSSTEFILIMDILGTIAFAVSGAMVAVRKRMDIFGVNILAVVTSTGGGLMRDVIIGDTPPVMFHKPVFVFMAAATANIVFLTIAFQNRKHTHLPPKFRLIYEKFLFWSDALGLAAFTVDGVNAGLNVKTHHRIFLMVFLGVITGVGGGLLRDLFANRTPDIFVKHVYACASMVGAIGMAIVVVGRYEMSLAIMTGFLLTLVFRALAGHYKWNLPKAL